MPEKVLISVMINNESKFAKKISKEITLPEVRKLLADKLPVDSIFTLPDGSEVDKNDEDDYTLSEIIKEDKVYIKSNELLSGTEKKTKKKNVPIPGSKLVGKKGDLDIYLYPKIEFNDTEKTKAW